MEIIGVYHSKGGILGKVFKKYTNYRIFVAIKNPDKKKINEMFENYSIHQTYGNSWEIIFNVKRDKARTIADKLREIEMSDLGRNGYSRLLKSLE